MSKTNPLRQSTTKCPPPSPPPRPSPPSPSPRLPEEQQAEFEALQKAAAASMEAAPAGTPDKNDPFFQNAKPEFEGEVNPKTGESGGPKTEPLRWGSQGDWSFNGKVTDF
ncbi:hypothetical protein jhhlp_001578 [Lomentospora prolificans]|uniref:Succinate dehydrogenase assembly factor 4, mitochondrial n=1 Tax=Lomentospora prolificans TaxID=41688 RepID=A0A2N3NIN4_9PEZI|nr:hypothetical protein jhhlp_001578 [Lomentospora prolificans]